MSKYEQLTAWLNRFPDDRVTLPFAEVEQIIGSRLPDSSHRHEPHWRGSTLGRPGGAIAAAGWRVERIDLMDRSISLMRRGGVTVGAQPPQTPPSLASTPDSPLATSATRPRPSSAEMRDDWQSFQERARRYFSQLWGQQLHARNVAVGEGRKRSTWSATT
jgi:hypothetical protein